MKLYEFEAKEIFRNGGIATPEGIVVTGVPLPGSLPQGLDFPLVIKPQLSVKKRGKAGAILFVEDMDRLEEGCRRLFSAPVRGEAVRRLLIEKKIDIEKEYYLAVTIDYTERTPVILAGERGGVDIEEIAGTVPESIHKFKVDILDGLDESQERLIERLFGEDFLDAARKLYRVFADYDAEIAEINPLVGTAGGGLVAVDAVLNVDDDAFYRQPSFAIYEENHPPKSRIEAICSRNNWTYIDLDGDIGILSSGAGLTMAILDIIRSRGGSAANFLDTAQLDGDGIYEAFKLMVSVEKAKVILVNIFAGLNRCDSLAEGIERFVEEFKPRRPLIIRMVGNREEDGYRILEKAGLKPYKTIEGAVEEAVRLAGGMK